MGTSERRAREKDELRRKILEAATEVFLEHGYANVSMRKIAERIEYAPSTIYLYFKDKLDLVSTICEEAFAELDHRLQEILDQGLPPLATLKESLRAYVRFGVDHPSSYAFVFCTPEGPFKELAPENHASINDKSMVTFNRLRIGIQACMDRGDIARADIEVTSQTVWLMVHGLTSGMAICEGFPFVERDKLVEEFLERVIRSLK